MKKMVLVGVGVVAALVVGVATGASGDQGRRLSGPFCVDLKDGVVHAVPQGHECTAKQIGKAGVAVSGPAGPQGPVGPQGAAGAQGGQGNAGASGASVTMKPIVAPDDDYEGDYPCSGASAYDGQIGVTLTVGDQSLVVCNGRPGKRGHRGYQGEQGPKGDDGAKGNQGDKGAKGEDGKDGKDGGSVS
jgi:hypothetical protein